jgi:hypothetical protein
MQVEAPAAPPAIQPKLDAILGRLTDSPDPLISAWACALADEGESTSSHPRPNE